MTKLEPGAARPITGVLGWPAAHSRSPVIHHYWLKAYGLNGVYAPFEISPAEVGGFFKMLHVLGVRGLNVTTPHKQAAYAAADTLSERARRVEAVNTLTVGAAGEVHGDITDGWGFLQNIETESAWRAKGGRALIFGAGGAAGAIVDQLVEAGAQVVISNRTREKAAAIAARYTHSVEVAAWPPDPALAHDCGLLINGTTLGMLGHTPDPSDLPWARITRAEHVVATDLIYAPLETAFLADLRGKGAAIVDGLGMLLHQARPGFERWHGVDPKVTEELRAAALRTTGYLP